MANGQGVSSPVVFNGPRAQRVDATLAETIGLGLKGGGVRVRRGGWGRLGASLRARNTVWKG